MNETISIFLKSAIIDNVVLIQYLAICPFIGMTNDTEKATGMGLATTFVIMLATAVTWPLYHFVMIPLGLQFLQTLFFILVIASLVQLVEFPNCNGGSDVVAQYPIQIDQDQLTGFDRIQAGVCSKDLLCHCHTHRVSSSFVYCFL